MTDAFAVEQLHRDLLTELEQEAPHSTVQFLLFKLDSWFFKIQVHAEVVATDNALRFFDKNSINVRVYSDEDEWQVFNFAFHLTYLQ